MNQWLRVLMGSVGLFWLTGSTCTSTFTEADLQASERKEDAAATSEEKRDQEIGEQGGENEEGIEEQVDDVDGGSGADF